MGPEEVAEWTSPGFFVPKADGGVRLVVDFKELNSNTVRAPHPFTAPPELKKGLLPGSGYFITIDCSHGYYQVPLDEESSKLTTFLLPSGRYRFLRTPMGINVSSDQFCNRSDSAFKVVPDMMKIVDDICLQGQDKAAVTPIFRLCLEQARKQKIKLSKEKLHHGESVKFAGYIISKAGLLPDPSKVAGIKDFPVPTNVTTLRSFLGLAQQLAFFLPDLAHMTEDLRQLLKKDITFVWLPCHQASF